MGILSGKLESMINQNINKLIWKIQKSSFIKSILTLSAGVVISQIISIGSTPIISRIYDPAILGDFAILISCSSIIGVIVCLGLMSAIMIPNDEEEAKGICRIVFLSIIVLLTILLIIVLALSGSWRAFNVGIDYNIACIILYIYIIATNVSSICYAYINRQKMYKVLFWNPVLGSLINAIVSILLGILGCGLWGFSLGNILAMVVIIVHMMKHANPFNRQFNGHEKYKYISILKKYKDFVRYALPANIIGTISQQVPIQMISRLFGSVVLGSYSMCMTILGIPSRFLAAPVNRVYYKEAIDRHNRGENIGEFSFKIIENNVKIAIIPIITMIIFSQPMFEIVLGEKWKTAGLYASLLAVYQLMAFCNSCISGKFIIIGKQKTILILNIVASILYFSLFLICNIESISATTTVLIFALCGALFEIIDTVIFMHLTKTSLKRYFQFALLYLFLPVVAAFILRGILFLS